MEVWNQGHNKSEYEHCICRKLHDVLLEDQFFVLRFSIAGGPTFGPTWLNGSCGEKTTQRSKMWWRLWSHPLRENVHSSTSRTGRTFYGMEKL
jgi:hypothetical protein